MSCAEIRERLFDRLYGLLDGPDAERLDLHVAACADCAEDMRKARARDGLFDLWTPSTAAVRPRRRPPYAGFAAVAGLLLAVGVAFYPSAPYDVEPGQATSSTRVRLGAAGRLELEPGSRIVLREGGKGRDHEVELVAGALRAEVHRTGRAFRVLAGDATVEVKGTRFRVSRMEDPSMKGAALVAVAAGVVVVSVPGGSTTLEGGQAALATPSGIERVDGGTSLEVARRMLDDLAKAVAEQEAKTRALREQVAALRAKRGPVELPPGATVRSLVDALAEAVRSGDREAIRRAVAVLDLLMRQDEAAVADVIAEIGRSRDPALAEQLMNALAGDGETGRVLRHKTAALALMLSADTHPEVRELFVGSFMYTLAYRGGLSAAEVSEVLRAARSMPANLRELLGILAAQQMRAEAWGDFERFLDAESDPQVRSRWVAACLDAGAGRDRLPAQAQALLFDALRGRYGPEAAADRLRRPLVVWFRPENGAAFAGILRQSAAAHADVKVRRAAAGQIAALYALQKTPEAIGALRQMRDAEPDAPARERMEQVLRLAEQGTLDMDTITGTLGLEWSF